MKIFLDSQKLECAADGLTEWLKNEHAPELTEDEVCQLILDKLPGIMETVVNDMLSDAAKPETIDNWVAEQLVFDAKIAVAKKSAEEKKSTAAMVAATTQQEVTTHP